MLYTHTYTHAHTRTHRPRHTSIHANISMHPSMYHNEYISTRTLHQASSRKNLTQNPKGSECNCKILRLRAILKAIIII